MKRTLLAFVSILVLLGLSVPLPAQGTYNMTQTEDIFRIKLNVYDYNTYDPAHPEKREVVTGVTFGINFRGSAGVHDCPGHTSETVAANYILTASGIDGVAYYSCSMTGTRLYAYGLDSNDKVNLLKVDQIDLDPIAGGYQWHIDTRKIRNFISETSTSNVEAWPRSAYGNSTITHDDIRFRWKGSADADYNLIHPGICIEMDVYVDLISPTTANHYVYYDLSNVSNGSQFQQGLTYAHNSTIASIPTPTNASNPSSVFDKWTIGNSSTEFIPGETQLKHNTTLVPNWITAHTVHYDLSNVLPSEHANYQQGLTYAHNATIASIPEPTNASNPSLEFDKWTIGNTSTEFIPGTTQITEDITLVPHWTNPDAKGLIHIETYIWDHDAYVANPLTMAFPNGSGQKQNGVYGHYKLEDYRNNPGWAKLNGNLIPVQGAEFILESYKDEGLAVITPADVIPVGRPNTYGPDWKSNPSVSRSTATDATGKATYEISKEQLAYLVEGNRIDIGPVGNLWCTFDRGYGLETQKCYWDLITESGDRGAAHPGVRYVKEGERHDNTGQIHISDHNDNDVVLITKDMINDGFEFTFVCFVAPSSVVDFDLNGGTLNNPDPALFPSQTFLPVSSVPEKAYQYRVINPGTPVSSDPNLYFAGWHEVRKPTDGPEYVEQAPYNFSKVVSHSFTLRAEYAEKVYTVRWADEGWNGSPNTVPPLFQKDETYRNGQNPKYDCPLPTKASDSDHDYRFYGWKMYQSNPDGDVDFGTLGKYEYVRDIPQTEMIEVIEGEIIQSTYYKSPEAIDASDQIYVAIFKPDENVVWKKRNGITIAKYKTLYDAVNNISPVDAVSGYDLTLANGDLLEFHGDVTETSATLIEKDNITLCSVEGKNFEIKNWLNTGGTESQHVAGITVSGENVLFERLKITGNIQENGIKNSHTVIISGGSVIFGDNCIISGHNSQEDTDGAAAIFVEASGTLYSGGTSDGPTFVSNESASSSGAIYNNGRVVITKGKFYVNKGYKGGAIYNAGTLVVNDCMAIQNSGLEGGVIYNASRLELNGGSFSLNTSTYNDSDIKPKGNAILQNGVLYLSGNPSFSTGMDIYLNSEKTAEGSGDTHAIIKSGIITSSSIPLRIGPADQNIYLGRNILESGTTDDATVLKSDLDLFSVLNETDLTDKVLKLGFTKIDAETGHPVIQVVKIPSKIIITKSGLKPGESAIFTVSNGIDRRSVVLTGKTGSSSVSITVSDLSEGEWVITENMSWSWAYTNSETYKIVAVTAGSTNEVTFTNTPKEKTAAHDETIKNNEFSEISTE